MAPVSEPEPPSLPFPIFRISSTIERYLLYDINTITWLRKTHHVLGVLIGTLPQIPQQNVFLGLPLELMHEEARLLSEKGLAYIVDDLKWHEEGFKLITAEQRGLFIQSLQRQTNEAVKAAEKKKLESTEKAMRRLRLDSPSKKLAAGSKEPTESTESTHGQDEQESLFASPISQMLDSTSLRSSSVSSSAVHDWAVTPTTSYPPLPAPPIEPDAPLPSVNNSSYALFKHLHTHGYFMSPGIRFGCQFLVYPGDPLRFHSHFLAVSADWDEEIDLMGIIGGGRLGTGVKKGWLIGGVEESDKNEILDSSHSGRSGLEEHEQDRLCNGAAKVRTFCIEWGGM